MLHKIEIIVKDACILFDLIDLEIFADFYQLDLIVFTTSQVIEEIIDEKQHAIINEYIENGKLLIDKYGHYETIIAIYQANPGLSFTDCSVLELAIRKNATILSSDKSLRNESQRRNIPVKGILWILEELYLKTYLSKEQVLNKLKIYPSINQRTPKNEIEKLMRKISN